MPTQQIEQLAGLLSSPWFLPLLAWTVIWKGLALWRAGTIRDKWWFIALLVLNTFGILEIFYYFVFSKRERKGAGTANVPPENQ